MFYSLKILQFPFKRILCFTYFDQTSQLFQFCWFLLLTFPVNWSPLLLSCFRWIPILLSICLLVWFSLKLPKVVLQHIPIKTPPNPQQSHCNPIAPHWCWQGYSAHNKRTAVESVSVLRSAQFNWVPLFIMASLSFHCTVPRTLGQRSV